MVDGRSRTSPSQKRPLDGGSRVKTRGSNVRATGICQAAEKGASRWSDDEIAWHSAISRLD